MPSSPELNFKVGNTSNVQTYRIRKIIQNGKRCIHVMVYYADGTNKYYARVIKTNGLSIYYTSSPMLVATEAEMGFEISESQNLWIEYLGNGIIVIGIQPKTSGDCKFKYLKFKGSILDDDDFPDYFDFTFEGIAERFQDIDRTFEDLFPVITVEEA